jgi:Tfp pilus assembly protein PilO
MADLRATRRSLKIVIGVLLALDLAAVALLFSPWIGSSESRRIQQDQLWKELQAKTRQVAPLRGMDTKILLARKEINDFYNDRFPSQDYAISEALGKLAAENGVQMGAVKYKMDDAEPVGLRPVEIQGEFSGGYVQLMKFINATERNRLFFIIDGVDFSGGQEQQQGNVRVMLKLETYLKTGAS